MNSLAEVGSTIFNFPIRAVSPRKRRSDRRVQRRLLTENGGCRLGADALYR